MTSNYITNGILKALGIIAFIAIIFYVVYKIQAVFVFIIVSLILTLIGSPIVSFLKNKLKFKNIFAVITTILFYIALIFGFIMMFVPLITSQGQSLSLLDTNAIESNINVLIIQIDHFFKNYNIDINQVLDFKNLTNTLDFEFIPSFLNSLIGTLSSFGIGILSVIFITFFFLKDKEKFVTGFVAVLPDKYENQVLISLSKINNLLSRYFIGLALQLNVVFILYLIVLLIFGVKNAFVIAFLCALLNIIPYLGPLMGMILAATLTLISNLGSDFQSVMLPTTIYVIIGFLVVQLIDNNINQPLIFSNSVKSHPLEIFIVILAAGYIFGIVGMIVAVPSHAIFKVFAKEFFPNNKIIQLITKKI